MKLRLNCDEQDLAYRFGVSRSTVSRLFNRWIVIMAQWLSLLIYWPSSDEVTKSMPQTFKKVYGRCICILDCTEIFIERPTDLVAQSQTWSNYKHHNTIKVILLRALSLSFLKHGVEEHLINLIQSNVAF